MVSNTATTRLRKDLSRIMKDPVPFVTAAPIPENILEWHYVVFGPQDTPYVNGIYHGKLVFPPSYPFKPPSIYMITPNGRFKTNTRLCLSISDFHPDTWNPAWSVSTILTGLLSFMVESGSTYGSITTSDYEKRMFAKKSIRYNLKDKTFCRLFPKIVEDCQKQVDMEDQLFAGGEKKAEGRPNPSTLRRFLEGSLSNVAIFLAVAIFAYIANSVIRSVS